MAAGLSAASILDTALAIAADRHWEKVRLADIAERLACQLADIHRYFPDKEALVDAWWDRADAAMLAAVEHAQTLPLHERIETLVFAWLGVFSGQRRTARQMVLVRLEPGHLHIQIPTLIRLSRTVQWLREAAGLHDPLPWRAIDETAMTALFAATVTRFLRSDDNEPARQLLRNGLSLRERMTGGSRPTASR